MGGAGALVLSSPALRCIWRETSRQNPRNPAATHLKQLSPQLVRLRARRPLLVLPPPASNVLSAGQLAAHAAPLLLGQKFNRHDVAVDRSVHVQPAADQQVLAHAVRADEALKGVVPGKQRATIQTLDLTGHTVRADEALEGVVPGQKRATIYIFDLMSPIDWSNTW